MKKTLLVVLFIFAAKISAQNIQLHYDMGEDRNYFTSTIEMFKPDEYGATFFFVDFDYDNPGNKSISLSYFEFARYINLPWVEGLSATLQYNDGNVSGYPLGHIFLGGFSYPLKIGGLTFNTDLLYRNSYQSTGADAQITTVWYIPFLENKISFTGFFDIWTQTDPASADESKQIVILTEPQLWYNIDKHISIGTEIEISHNFLPYNEVKVMPTAAFKWIF